MPRSERCRIRGNCLDGIALPSLAQASVAGGALPLVDFLTAGGRLAAHGRLIGPERAVERA